MSAPGVARRRWRPPGARTAGGAAVAVMLALAGSGCSSEGGALPTGSYGGSTADSRAFRLTVGDEIEVNGTEADYGPKGTIVVPDGPTVRCRVQADGEELRCEVQHGERTETIELMRE